MLSDKQVENVTFGIVSVLIIAIMFVCFGFIVYQVRQTRNMQIEYCREMKIQPKDCE